MEDKCKLKGNVEIILCDKGGNIKDQREIENTIVDGGYDFICDVIGNTTQPGDMAWTAIGTGTTPVSSTDTTLETEVARITNTYNHVPGTKFFTHIALYATGVGTGDITESALLNASSTGIMLNRVVFPVVSKLTGDTLNIVWTITLS